ncbi:MAG: hypothetical protein WBW57_13005, partial [Candidatus Sulfotelmatobacter sp.]
MSAWDKNAGRLEACNENGQRRDWALAGEIGSPHGLSLVRFLRWLIALGRRSLSLWFRRWMRSRFRG